MASRRSRSPVSGPAASRSGLALRLLWWGLCLGVLAWWLAVTGVGNLASAIGPEGQDSRLYFALLALIAFPAGLIWVLALPWLLGAVPAIVPWYAEPLLAWTGCTLLGYAQWFWVVPHAFALNRTAE